MYDMKALYQAKSVADAVALRVAHPEAQIIAGGSDVLVQMREGKRAGVELISIYGLDELRGVTMEDDGTLRIGSLTSFSHITRDPLIQKYLNVLGKASVRLSSTSLSISRRRSYCVTITPPITSAGFILFLTSSIVSRSWAIPLRAK